MSILKDLNTVLGLINGGADIREVNETYPEMMKVLFEMSADTPKKTFKGEIKLVLKVDVRDGVAEVGLDVTTKLPKKPKRTEMFWIDKTTGFLSTDHPRQINMFPDRDRSIDGGKVIDSTAVVIESAATG